jgi:hypothetical protein
MGTSGSQRRGFRRTRAGAGVGCRLWGVGAAFWCPKWPVPLSRLFGGGLESHINPLKSVGKRHRGVVRGWSPPRTGQVCERVYRRKRPGSTPNPESGSEIVHTIRVAVYWLCFPLVLGLGRWRGG